MPKNDQEQKKSKAGWGILIILVVVAGICIVVTGNNIIVKHPNGYTLLPKHSFTFEDTYIDITHWHVVDFYRGSTAKRIKRSIINRRIPDYKHMRARLIAADAAIAAGKSVHEAMRAAKRKLKELDERFGVSEQAKEIDKKYGIKKKKDKAVEKTRKGVRKGVEGAKKLLKKWKK